MASKHSWRDLYTPCSIAMENPEGHNDTPIKAIQEEQQHEPWLKEKISYKEHTDYIKLKPKARSFFEGVSIQKKQHDYLIRTSFNEESQWESGKQKEDEKMTPFNLVQEKSHNINNSEDVEYQCALECLKIREQNDQLRKMIEKARANIQEECNEGDRLLKTISSTISGVSHWQKGYFDCTKVNVELDAKISQLTQQIQQAQNKSKNKNSIICKEQQNNSELLKVLQSIETIKSIESSGSKPISINSKEPSLESSMRVSMISSSGKKYTKVAPIADWDELFAKPKSPEKGPRKRIFVNNQKMKNNSCNYESQGRRERLKPTTIIDIPKLFQRNKENPRNSGEEERKMRKNKVQQENYENIMLMGNIKQKPQKPAKAQAQGNPQKVCVRLSLCKK